MADISKIKLTDNTEYDIKDAIARNNVTQLNENKLDKTSLKNESSTANNEGYSANYLNDKLVSVGTTAPTTGERVWFGKSKNKFDKSKADVIAGYLDASGNVVSGGTSSATRGYTPITPNTNMVLSGSPFTVYAFYDQNKNFIERIVQGSESYTFNKNAYYMRFQGYTDTFNLNTIQLELGLTATEFEPFVEEGIYVDERKLFFDNYSTDEKIIGTWINGKPIYRKVIDITGSVTAQTVSIDHNISNIQEVVDQRCIFLRAGGQYRQLPTTFYGNTNWNGQMYITSTKITLELAISIFEAVRDSSYCKVVIEYTKTTD